MARILIADDDPEYRDVFRDGLNAKGHQVVCVSSGAEVLPMIKDEDFDIVFLDVVMSGGGAITILHELRDYHVDLPTVIITGRPALAESPLFMNGLRFAHAKMEKTASLSEIDQVVRRLTTA